MKFTILLENGKAINEKTVIRTGGVINPIKNELDICNLIKRDWCKNTQVKSFARWAEELNADENFNGNFTVSDALDNLCSTYHLEINGKAVDLYDFFNTYKPLKTV